MEMKLKSTHVAVFECSINTGQAIRMAAIIAQWQADGLPPLVKGGEVHYYDIDFNAPDILSTVRASLTNVNTFGITFTEPGPRNDKPSTRTLFTLLVNKEKDNWVSGWTVPKHLAGREQLLMQAPTIALFNCLDSGDDRRTLLTCQTLAVEDTAISFDSPKVNN